MRHCLFSFLFLFQTYFTLAQTEQWESFIPNRFAYDCLVEGEFLYALTFNGMIKYNLKTDTYEFYNKSNTLIFMDDDNFKTKDIGSFYWWITDIFIDRNNTKWIGTSGGLFKVTDDTVQSYYSWNSGIPSYYILSISEDAFGNLWIGTIDGLAKLKNDVWTVYDTLNSGLPNNVVYEVFVDRYQNVWCGTEQGLAKFNGLTWTVYSLSNSQIGENYIHHFAIDKVNHIWLCNSKGLHHFNGTKWETFDELNSKLPTNFINDIKVDSRNTNGLVCFMEVWF